MLYKSNLLTLETIGYSLDIYCYGYCLWAQVAVLLMLSLYWTAWDMFMQVMYLGRAPRTKETLPNFLKWRRVTRHPLVFRGLTGSQRPPGFGASQPRHGPACPRPGRCAHAVCAQPGSVECAPCALDSVHCSESLFGTLFMSTVHEVFKKKISNQIKSNFLK